MDSEGAEEITPEHFFGAHEVPGRFAVPKAVPTAPPAGVAPARGTGKGTRDPSQVI